MPTALVAPVEHVGDGDDDREPIGDCEQILHGHDHAAHRERERLGHGVDLRQPSAELQIGRSTQQRLELVELLEPRAAGLELGGRLELWIDVCGARSRGAVQSFP